MFQLHQLRLRVHVIAFQCAVPYLALERRAIEVAVRPLKLAFSVGREREFASQRTVLLCQNNRQVNYYVLSRHEMACDLFKRSARGCERPRGL